MTVTVNKIIFGCMRFITLQYDFFRTIVSSESFILLKILFFFVSWVLFRSHYFMFYFINVCRSSSLYIKNIIGTVPTNKKI